MDEFEAARIAGLANLQNRQGIGTLKERSLHSILKFWADPDENHHEILLGLGRIVVDVFDGECVTEIQTRSFNTLRTKLDRILPLYSVRVVYPIAHTKKIIWVDEDSGETTQPRKSPKTGSVWDVFPELYRIRSYLVNPRLTIRLVLLDMDEYKLLNGWSKDRKKGACRMERIPTGFCRFVDLTCATDYTALLPDNLPNVFTSADLSDCIHINKRKAGYVVNVMYNINSIIRIGKKSNAYLYKRAE